HERNLFEAERGGAAASGRPVRQRSRHRVTRPAPAVARRLECLRLGDDHHHGSHNGCTLIGEPPIPATAGAVRYGHAARGRDRWEDVVRKVIVTGVALLALM